MRRGDARRSVLRLGARTAVLLALVPGLAVLATPPARADPAAKDWARLRACESSGRYDVVATHQHYGAYQFDLPTWRSVGGEGLPSAASAEEQDYRALLLYRMRGWQPWECAGILGLEPENDARSGRAAGRAEAADMRPPASAPDGSGTIGPTWPGMVFQPGDCDPVLKAWQLRMNAPGTAAPAQARRDRAPRTAHMAGRPGYPALTSPEHRCRAVPSSVSADRGQQVLAHPAQQPVALRARS